MMFVDGLRDGNNMDVFDFLVHKFKFKKKAIKNNSPHFDAYKNEVFIIDHLHPQSGEKVWLICVSDRNLNMGGYVSFNDLELHFERDPKSPYKKILRTIKKHESKYDSNRSSN